MGSVWNKEVDIGYLEYIKSIVKHYDEEDNLIATKVFVRNPEEDFTVRTFPSVTIYNYDQKFDKMRYDMHDINTGDIDTNGNMRIEKSALPYNLFYQIEFWAEYQEDLNEMTRRWVANTEPVTILRVVDTEGTVRYCNMLLVDVANVDLKKEEKRVFHRVYSYKVWVELDERNPIYTKVVLERDIRRESL